MRVLCSWCGLPRLLRTVRRNTAPLLPLASGCARGQGQSCSAYVIFRYTDLWLCGVLARSVPTRGSDGCKPTQKLWQVISGIFSVMRCTSDPCCTSWVSLMSQVDGTVVVRCYTVLVLPVALQYHWNSAVLLLCVSVCGVTLQDVKDVDLVWIKFRICLWNEWRFVYCILSW